MSNRTTSGTITWHMNEAFISLSKLVMIHIEANKSDIWIWRTDHEPNDPSCKRESAHALVNTHPLKTFTRVVLPAYSQVVMCHIVTAKDPLTTLEYFQCLGIILKGKHAYHIGSVRIV